MSITKKIELNQKEIERKRKEFIDNGGQVCADKKNKKDFTNVLVRIPIQILKNLDSVVKRKPWMNRTQWIVEAIRDQLE